MQEAKPELCDCSSPQPAAARDGSCSPARSLQDQAKRPWKRRPGRQTLPETPKFPSCSQGNTEHRLRINITASSTRCFITSAASTCFLLLPPRAFRSPRGCARHGAFRKTHLQETAGDVAQKTAGDAARPPRGREHAGSRGRSQTSPPAGAGEANPPGSAHERASFGKVPRMPTRRQLFIPAFEELEAPRGKLILL